jgi:hypothetical protein
MLLLAHEGVSVYVIAMSEWIFLILFSGLCSSLNIVTC